MFPWNKALWLLALPILIWVVLRASKAKDPLQKSLAILLGAATTSFLVFAFFSPNVDYVGIEPRMRDDIKGYWWLAGFFAFATYLAARLAARTTVRQAWLAAGAVTLWSLVFWGLMIGTFVESFG